MFTRSQAKIYQQKQQQEQKVKQMSDIIKNHLNVINNGCLCTGNRIEKINNLYEYMLTDETKQNLLLPRFPNFRVSLIKKTNELKTDILVKIQKEKSTKRQAKNLELLDNLNAMNCFLQEHQQQQEPLPPASAYSPRKKVSTQVLLRRSARLMAKYA